MSVQLIDSDGKILAWLGKNCGFFIDSILFLQVDIFQNFVTVWGSTNSQIQHFWPIWKSQNAFEIYTFFCKIIFS